MIENFGKNVTKLRKSKNLSQEQLAEKVGLKKQSISNIERGNRYPTFETLEKIASVLEASPIELFGTEKEIMISDIPTILEDIDNSEEMLRTVFKAEKILDEICEPIKETADNISIISSFIHGEIILDEYGEPKLNKNGEFIRTKSPLETLPIDLINKTANNISIISSFIHGEIILDEYGEPKLNKNNEFIYKKSPLDALPIDLINKTAENLRFILDNKDKI
ncbi:helix-turn-helix transcriptional regulator [Enterococcus gallinarum]|uniref:helix-turn-helix transcriptional regulator n=1 Tax=Enterococcus gallinarum TaxID=1353 RepID=UPI00288F3654|nr:helix-turn-helix transcriptional regulator [Enterococcus gallinarum]MDT2698499.1 helix-turn-helix transcriptional regulator [Enterococcus gallinarum]MDT2730483.1 helix-turn-helix transcriptional regulator [Enterococcus gallinarum]